MILQRHTTTLRPSHVQSITWWIKSSTTPLKHNWYYTSSCSTSKCLYWIKNMWWRLCFQSMVWTSVCFCFAAPRAPLIWSLSWHLNRCVLLAKTMGAHHATLPRSYIVLPRTRFKQVILDALSGCPNAKGPLRLIPYHLTHGQHAGMHLLIGTLSRQSCTALPCWTAWLISLRLHYLPASNALSFKHRLFCCTLKSWLGCNTFHSAAWTLSCLDRVRPTIGGRGWVGWHLKCRHSIIWSCLEPLHKQVSHLGSVWEDVKGQLSSNSHHHHQRPHCRRLTFRRWLFTRTSVARINCLTECNG